MLLAEENISAPEVGKPGSLDVRQLAAVMRRGRRIIIASVATCCLLGVGYTLVDTPKYNASARILIDPAGLQIVGTGLASQTMRDTSGIEAESQIYVMTSGNVLDAVIVRENLDTHPLFGARQPGLLKRLLSTTGVSTPENTRARAKRQLDRAMSVSRSPGSFVLNVNVQTENRDLSVKIADAVLDAYLDEQRKAQAETARRAADSLVTRLGDLQARLRTAEERYEDFRQKSGIITSAGQPLLEKEVSDISGAIGAATTRVTDLSAILQQMRQMREGQIDTLPESFRGGTLETLRNRYAAATQLQSNVAATLGPRHPDYVTASSQTTEARRLFDKSVSDVMKSITAELERAKAGEFALRGRLENSKTDLGTTNEASVRLRELARDVDANRALYESFLARSRELNERERLDTSNTRILSRATRPIDASGPPAILIIIASILLGLGLGVALAWMSELYFKTRPRTLQP